jgi:hypothetical protein
MQKIKSFNKFIIIIFLLSLILLVSCTPEDINSHKTLTVTDGTVHFSFEYRSYYKIKEVEPGGNLGNVTHDICYVTLISPLIDKINDHTTIDIIVDKPDQLVPDALSGIIRAENNASSWKGYKLLDKSYPTIDNFPAYRIDYTDRNPIPAIAGIKEPLFEVIREVRFDAKGFVWMIQINSDSSTAEVDKADFEYILKTFKVLD